MAANAFQNWNSPSQAPDAGSLPLLGPQPFFRNQKDAKLASFGSSPDTQHPDGYLGTITNRRQDKLLGAITRNNARPYTRGVHKGERINSGDYMWPKEFNPMTSLVLEAQGKRFAPVGAGNPVLTNDGKVGPRGIPTGLDRPQKDVINTQRRALLKDLAPTWR